MSRVFMRRQISSSATGFYKLMWSFSVVFILVILPLLMLTDEHTKQTLFDGFAFGLIIMGLIFSLIAYWSWGWKTVEVENDKLIISQTFPKRKKQVVTKLSNVGNVYTSFLRGSIVPIVILFKHPTELGDKVTFIAEHTFSFWSEHPVVGELKQLAKDAKHLSKRH